MSIADAETSSHPTPADPAALFEGNVRLAFHIANRAVHPRGGFDRADVEQEALIGLWEAAQTFDPAKGSFGAWAAMKAKDRVTRYFLAKANRPFRQHRLKRDEDGEEVGDASEDVVARPAESPLQDREEVERLLGILPPRDRRAVELRFGVGDGVERSSEEVAEELGVSRQRIDQVLRRSLELMRSVA